MIDTVSMSTRETLTEQRIARQAISPYNIDDAEYILAHPKDFTEDIIQLAINTESRYYLTKGE